MRRSASANANDDPLVQESLDHLAAIPGINVTWQSSAAGDTGFDGILTVRTGTSRAALRFLVDIKRTHLSYALVNGVVTRHESLRHPPLLIAPYVAPPMGQHLADHGVSYIDALGNCHLGTEKELLVHIEGRKPTRVAARRGAGRIEGHQLAFAILARPELLQRPVREIADAAGIGKTAVSDQLTRWVDQGVVGRAPSGMHLIRPKELLDRWLAAYQEVVRPRWLVGVFRTREPQPDGIERNLREVLGETRWALGGAAAGWHLTRHLRVDEVVVHMSEIPNDLPRQLRALPADGGGLVILRTPGTVAYSGAEPHVVHPLLAYTEMMSSRDARVRAAAEQVRERYLAALR